MSSIYYDSSRQGWRVTVSVNGLRRSLWLGNLQNRKGVNDIAHYLQDLATAAECNCPPSLDAQQWAANVGPRIGSKLAQWGLVASTAARTALPATLGPWIDHYIDQRTDTSERTRDRYKNARKRICAVIPETTPLTSITEGDADRLARQLHQDSKPTTAAKILKQAKMFLEAARKDRVIVANPFSHLSGSAKIDETRKTYVPAKTVELLIAKAPDATWRLILALTRYAGFRSPSEIVTLQWSHIDWENETINNHSPKTGLRKVPIFKEVRKYLDQCWESADDAAIWVIPQYRSTNSAPITRQLHRICKLAGVKCWPKPWVNLRGSARTDLEKRFPNHVCNAWLGHGSDVADVHYLSVTASDHQKAVSGRGAPGGARKG